MRKVGGIMTASLTAPIVAGMGMAVNAAGDLEQSIGAVEVVFGDAADTILDFSDTSSTMVGLAKSDYQQLAAEAGALLLNMGMDTDTAADATVNLAQRAADMAAVYNTDVTTAMEAIQSGLRGMGRPLTSFGVKLDVATVEAKALEMGLIGVGEEMGQTEKATATLAVIMDQTANISGHFASEAETLDGQMKRLKAELGDAAAELGVYLLPAVTDAVKSIRELVEQFRDLDPSVQKGIIVFAGLVAAIGPMLVVGGQAIIWASKFKGALVALKPAIIAVDAALAGTAGTVAIVTGAIIAAAAALAVWRKQVKKAEDESNDLGDSIVDSSDSYDDYVKAVKAANGETPKFNKYISSTSDALGQGMTQVNTFASQVDLLTEAEWEAQRALRAAGLDAGYYADMAAMAEGASKDFTNAIEDQTTALESDKFKAYLSLTESYSDTLDDLNDKQGELNGLLELQAEQGYGYYEGTWYSASDLETKIGDVRDEVNGLKQDMSSTANQIVLDMAMAEASIDGIITPEEYQEIQDLGVALGEFSREAADTSVAEFTRAYTEWQKLKFDDKSVNVHVNVTGGSVNLGNQNIAITGNIPAPTGGAGGAGLNNGIVTPHLRALGGPINANQPYLVGERGPELIVPNTSGQVIPNDELGGNRETNFYIENHQAPPVQGLSEIEVIKLLQMQYGGA